MLHYYVTKKLDNDGSIIAGAGRYEETPTQYKEGDILTDWNGDRYVVAFELVNKPTF